jgi:hypothetical protein
MPFASSNEWSVKMATFIILVRDGRHSTGNGGVHERRQ